MTVTASHTARRQRAEQINPAIIRPLGHDLFYVLNQSSSINYAVL